MWIYPVKNSAFSFLAPTKFGAEYCLTDAITYQPPKTDPPCSAISLQQLSYLFWILTPYSQDPAPIFTRPIRQMTLFRTRDVPFGGPENKLLHFDPIPQTSHWVLNSWFRVWPRGVSGPVDHAICLASFALIPSLRSKGVGD